MERYNVYASPFLTLLIQKARSINVINRQALLNIFGKFTSSRAKYRKEREQWQQHQ